MRLKRTKQCAKCPWRVDIDPFDIPDGYSVELHRALQETIADPDSLSLSCGKAMSCHEHHSDEQVFCVGWLWNQLGVGNNIALRMQMIHCENADMIEVVGEQHKHFRDTLPTEVSQPHES